MIYRKQSNLKFVSTHSIADHFFEQRWVDYCRDFSATHLLPLLNTLTTFPIILKMMLIVLLLRAGNTWYLELPITLLCMVAILQPMVLQNYNFWFVITVVLAAGNYQDWYSIDNHKYLITYTCLAIYLSLLTPTPERTFAHNARYLIGLCFLLATLWKVISPDYLDSSFFHYKLLTDSRFQNAAEFFSGYTSGMFLDNKATITALLRFNSVQQTIQLYDTLLIHYLAQCLTWWTILIEGVVAAAFLCPTQHRFSAWRHPLLLSFLFTTYTIAPVIGFGWVLAVLGAAQATDAKHLRFIYLTAFFIILIYSAPWSLLSYNIWGITLPFSN